ncbi:hypothetical protein L1D14_23065 [Vibrio tubiashii]|uniref:DUF6685 family protein n=1 Tax=Vibrio tubiashii TaxID=29498 RepID=UPI001EFE7021|nr:DUF6685 family protein [Vibrio tubiashii]MCG9579086.1 hypothetical protein [Vibrio tubiashii]
MICKLIDTVRAATTRFDRLARLCEDHAIVSESIHALTTVSNIDIDCAPAWHKLDLKRSQGVIYFNGGQEYCWLHDLKLPLVIKSESVHEIDIQDVYGFAASKSLLSNYETTDAMICQPNRRNMIRTISNEALLDALSWHEIRILHSPDGGGDRLHYFEYLERYFLANTGGSHHFAAAKYIAKKLGESVTIKGKTLSYQINPMAVEELNRNYRGILITTEELPAFEIRKQLQKQRVRYFHLSFNQCGWTSNWHLFLYPNNSRLSGRAYQVMKQYGGIDLTSVLHRLLNVQKQQRLRI